MRHPMHREWTGKLVIGRLEAAFRTTPDAAIYSVSTVDDLPCDAPIEGPHLIQATALALGLDSPARIHLLYDARARGTGESICKLCRNRSWTRSTHYKHVTAASIALAEWLNARAIKCPDTRDSLQAAKARGKKRGNPNLAQAAGRYAANVLPVIREIQASGVKSLRGVVRALAERGIPTARGGSWTRAQVSAILRRGG